MPTKNKKATKESVSRRDFLKTTSFAAGALGAGAVGSSSPNAPACASSGAAESASIAAEKAAQVRDYTKFSAALQPDAVIDAACQFCNSLCGLKVQVKGGRIVDVRGRDDDPVQAGELCVKASMMTQLVYNRFRLTRPLKRVAGVKGSPDGKFEPVAWDEALEIIARKFLALRDEGAAYAIASKTSGRMARGSGALIARFFTLLGSPNDTDVGPVCNDAGGNALAMTFGLGSFTNGYGVDAATGKEDLGSSKFFLFLGTNQAETHPVTFSHLLRCREKTGAKLTVIDPRKTPTAAYADEWLAPKPHTDLALVLAMLRHIVENQLHDTAFVTRWVLGFDELKKRLLESEWTPEWAAKVTGVPAKKIVGLAENYARTKPAAIFCNAGISHQLNAFDTYRALTFLSAITGNVGVAGGGCNFMHNTWPGELYLPPVVGDAPVRGAALPVGPDYFAESILTAKPYALRAVVTAGNPLIGCANSKKVAEAFRKLEFYVYTGLFMEEAAYYADVILPVCSGFEMETVYMRRDDRAIRWQKQVVPRVGESRPDWEIWIDLAHAMAKLDAKKPSDYWTKNFPLEWKDYKNLWATFVAHTPGMGGMTQARLERRATPLQWPCPTLDHPGTSTLYLDHPSWMKCVADLKPSHAGKRFLTPSGKIEIFTSAIEARLSSVGHSALPTFYTHPEVVGGLPTIEYSTEWIRNPINPHSVTPKVKLGARSNGVVHREFPLMGVIGRASVVHFAGVTQWTYAGKQLNGVRLIQIHPKTAAQAGVKNGDAILVESPRGAISGTALLWDDIREDTIFVPNSFGPAQKMGEEFGLPFYETANTLVDDGFYDNLSGQQAYKCFACRIKKA
jgi:anaerobic selenocysteine-containing dehydrogenase